MRRRNLIAILGMAIMALSFGPTVHAGAGVPDLVVASSKGDLGKVKAMLAKGANVNARDPVGHTALMAATWSGNVDVARALIAAGADVNATVDGTSALLLATGTPFTDIVTLLIEAGADVNVGRGSSGGSPLIHAALNGRVEQVALLLAHQADPNARDQFGRTALMVGPTANAAEPGDALARRENVVRLLIEAHADVNARDNHGRTAIWHAGVKSRVADLLREAGATE